MITILFKIVVGELLILLGVLHEFLFESNELIVRIFEKAWLGILVIEMLEVELLLTTIIFLFKLFEISFGGSGGLLISLILFI